MHLLQDLDAAACSACLAVRSIRITYRLPSLCTPVPSALAKVKDRGHEAWRLHVPAVSVTILRWGTVLTLSTQSHNFITMQSHGADL